jgi:hypothetical protein
MNVKQSGDCGSCGMAGFGYKSSERAAATVRHSHRPSHESTAGCSHAGEQTLHRGQLVTIICREEQCLFYDAVAITKTLPHHMRCEVDCELRKLIISLFNDAVSTTRFIETYVFTTGSNDEGYHES